MRLFYWNLRPNLGDRLTDWLLRKRGIVPEWAPPHEAELVGIGSVLEWFDQSTATIWGSGRAGMQNPPTDLGAARVRALRGMKTLELVRGAGSPVLGDPGLLVQNHLTRSGGGGVVIVPHWQDQERMRATYPTASFADVLAPNIEPALDVIRRADRVISSSLHGLIFADAWGIPRMWDWFNGVQGGGFKFHDYFTVIGGAEPGVWYTAPVKRVAEVQRDLGGALEAV